MRVVLFANGRLPNLAAAKQLLQPGDFLIGVDGGSRYIMRLGFMPNLVIGDLDSFDEKEKQAIETARVPIQRYPTDKDETDLELGILRALSMNPPSILVIAALGGRLDQTLANIALLTAPQLSEVDIRLDDGDEEVFFCRKRAQLRGRAGDTVSLIPWNKEAKGVETIGLKWQLDNETLFPHKTRGISNQMTEATAAVAIKSGLLLVVHRRAHP